jgi:tetratricopeptide (TPR) repeat protein
VHPPTQRDKKMQQEEWIFHIGPGETAPGPSSRQYLCFPRPFTLANLPLCRFNVSRLDMFRNQAGALVMSTRTATSLFIIATLILSATQGVNGQNSRKYSTDKEAFGVGAAFYNSRNFKASREPFEAVLKLTKDDELRLKTNESLLQAYRLIPEFEPFRDAAEYVISNATRDAQRSLTRRSFVGFSYQRGQIDNLINRYEKRLKKNSDDYLSVYMLSEIYQRAKSNPQRAIAMIKQLEVLNKVRNPSRDGKSDTKLPPAEAAKIARAKSKLAMQYARSKDYKNAAKVYLEIAPLDPSTQAWNLKEAASALLKLGKKKEALRVALEADKAKPEARNDQLAQFFHRNLGNILLSLNEPARAVPHFKIALEKNKNPGYVEGIESSLARAVEQSEQ